MNKLKLIIAREYLEMVKRKSFIVITLLMPLLVLLVGGIPVLISQLNGGGETKDVIVIDETGKYAAALADNDTYHFVALRGDTVTDARAFYEKTDGSSEAMIVIPRDIDSTAVVNIYSEGTINLSLREYVAGRLSDTISQARIASYNIPELKSIIDKANVDVTINSVKWSDDGSESESSTEMAMIIGMIFSMFIYMFVLMYGAMIMNGVVEEKTNRIVEVIVSSCKPFQLMMGKIIGVGLVGLTQFAVWVLVIGAVILAMGGVSSVGVDAGASEDMMAMIMSQVASVNYLPIISWFVLYFIGGYLLYAALFAAFGSAVDQASDASQFTSPIIIIMIVALYAGMGCIDNPNGPMAVWCSMIPFTSPIVMMIRVPYDVPAWQMVASLALLYATAAGIVWVAARIYRTGILMYGKKHTIKDIFKWIKQ